MIVVLRKIFGVGFGLAFLVSLVRCLPSCLRAETKTAYIIALSEPFVYLILLVLSVFPILYRKKILLRRINENKYKLNNYHSDIKNYFSAFDISADLQEKLRDDWKDVARSYGKLPNCEKAKIPTMNRDFFDVIFPELDDMFTVLCDKLKTENYIAIQGQLTDCVNLLCNYSHMLIGLAMSHRFYSAEYTQTRLWGVGWNQHHHRFFQQAIGDIEKDYDRDSNDHINIKVIGYIKKILCREGNICTNSMIDIGCGYGRLSKAYGSFFKSITLIDPDQAVYTAESQIRDIFKSKEIIAVQQPMSLNEHNTYDAVICSHVMQHLHTDIRNHMYDHLSAYLKQNGMLIFFAATSRQNFDEYVIEGLSNFFTFSVPNKFIKEMEQNYISSQFTEFLSNALAKYKIDIFTADHLTLSTEENDVSCINLIKNDIPTNIYFAKTRKGIIGHVPRDIGVFAKHSFVLSEINMRSDFKENIVDFANSLHIAELSPNATNIQCELDRCIKNVLLKGQKIKVLDKKSPKDKIGTHQNSFFFSLNHECMNRIVYCEIHKDTDVGDLLRAELLFCTTTAMQYPEQEDITSFVKALRAMNVALPAKIKNIKMTNVSPDCAWKLESHSDDNLYDRVLIIKQNGEYAMTYLPRQYYITKRIFDNIMDIEGNNPCQALGTYRIAYSSIKNKFSDVKIKNIYYYHLLYNNKLMRFLFANRLFADRFVNHKIWSIFMRVKLARLFDAADVCVIAHKSTSQD